MNRLYRLTKNQENLYGKKILNRAWNLEKKNYLKILLLKS